MKILKTIVLPALLAVLAVAGVRSFAEDKAAAASDKKVIIWPADKVPYKELPNMMGISKADLWGNSEKGTHGTLTKFPAGTKVPLHWHSNDVKMVVVAGTIIYGDEDGKTTELAPGSYLREVAEKKHTTTCAPGADCIFFEYQTGAFDIKMAQAAPPTATPATATPATATPATATPATATPATAAPAPAQPKAQ